MSEPREGDATAEASGMIYLSVVDEEDFGLFAKEQALDAHEANVSDLLPRCRDYLRTLYRSTLRAVDADDAREWLDLAQIPESQRGELDWFGALFRGNDWQAVGWTQSRHPANHARVIRTWKPTT